MILRTFRRLDFRTQRVQELASPLTKKHEEFDHIAIDLGDLIANAIRTKEFKFLVGVERFEPMYKHVQNNLSNIFRKIHARKSLVFLMDGTEGLWKSRKNRKRATRKQETFIQRSAGSPLAFSIEDRLQCALLSRQTPTELLFSGTTTPGCAESKMVSWGLDLAARPDISKNDSICLVGSSTLYMTALGLTPFLNITCIKFDMGDFKVQTLPGILEWLDISRLTETGELGVLSRARTDLILLILLLDGWIVTDLPELQLLHAKDLLQAYQDLCLVPRTYLCEEKGDHIKLNVPLMQTLFSLVSKTRLAKRSANAADYFEIALQSHHMLTIGGVRNQLYTVTSGFEADSKASNTISADNLNFYLKKIATPRLCCTSSSERLTAAEYFLMTSSTASHIEDALKAYSPKKFFQVQSGLADKLLRIENPIQALESARSLLSDLRSRHRGLGHTPTHIWTRVVGAPGPPPGYVYFASDLGELAKKKEIRLRAAAGKGFEDTQLVKAQSPRLVGFDLATGDWVDHETNVTHSLPPFSDAQSCLRIITWNVQFSRFSGQTTPLGRPGIDWCSETRYVALSKILSEADADLICMQECEPPLWNYLAQQSWVRRNFYFSSTENGDCLSPWGSLMLIRRRFFLHTLHHLNVPGFTGHRSLVPVLTLKLTPNSLLHVFCVHLLAPFRTESEDHRKAQVSNLVRRIETRYAHQDLVLLGDFNDYPMNMLKFPEKLELNDAWVKAHGDALETEREGYTINGDRNTYCALIIEPEFFGRADRIYFRSKSLLVNKVSLLGKRSVREELGIFTCPEYLFPSDHFGVLSDFDLSHGKETGTKKM